MKIDRRFTEEEQLALLVLLVTHGSIPATRILLGVSESDLATLSPFRLVQVRGRLVMYAVGRYFSEEPLHCRWPVAQLAINLLRPLARAHTRARARAVGEELPKWGYRRTLGVEPLEYLRGAVEEVVRLHGATDAARTALGEIDRSLEEIARERTEPADVNAH